MSKIGLWAAGTLLVMVLLAGTASALNTNACSDGTAYFQCSSKSPGYLCMLDPSGNGMNVLVNVLGDSGTPTLRAQCACSKYPGYVEVNGECMKTTCTDPGNSQTLQNGICASTPPKQCASGQLVDNSTGCHCPLGQKPNADGKKCDPRVGCRWGTLPTPSGKDCNFDQNNPNDDGTLNSKPGCAYNPALCDSTQDCDTSTNSSGICVTKKGCAYDNPKCNANETCVSNGVISVCQKKTSDLPLVNLSASTTNATVSSGLDLSKICPCCPAPAVGAVAMVGLVSYRKWKKKEE